MFLPTTLSHEIERRRLRNRLETFFLWEAHDACHCSYDTGKRRWEQRGVWEEGWGEVRRGKGRRRWLEVLPFPPFPSPPFNAPLQNGGGVEDDPFVSGSVQILFAVCAAQMRSVLSMITI